MQNRFLIGLIAITALAGTSDVHSAATNTADTVQRLGSSKHTLISGIRHAEKLGGTAISAKFEVEDGKFWLSVYSAKNGMEPDAEHNTLIEYKGEANEALFDPKPEVFQDVPHVARSAMQLTLLQVATSSLEGAIKKASSIESGTVYSAIPMVKNGQPSVEVALATREGKTVTVDVDLRSGKAVKHSD
jgi:hypothetical protein